MYARLIETVTGATASTSVDESADRTAQRILDAALTEAAAVGLDRITVEDVVRRAGVSRMTAYRRYPRRDELVEALVQRETQRFLGAVADAIDAVDDPHDGVAEAFVAAVRFARAHPMVRRVGQAEPAVIGDWVEPMALGAAFIANYIHGEALGAAVGSGLRRRRGAPAVRPRGAHPDGGARRRIVWSPCGNGRF